MHTNLTYEMIFLGLLTVSLETWEILTEYRQEQMRGWSILLRGNNIVLLCTNIAIYVKPLVLLLDRITAVVRI